MEPEVTRNWNTTMKRKRRVTGNSSRKRYSPQPWYEPEHTWLSSVQKHCKVGQCSFSY